ncbi:MAG: Fic family protein [Coriobacteriales bacterium]|jgi:Fic family protein|nr:Fic family protein [Coriobacteriales bacterium]
MQDEYSIDTVALREMLQAQRRTQMKGGIYHYNQIDFAYNSNRIEGSRLTHEQTRYIFETKTVEGMAPVNDVIEMVNSFRLFDQMLDKLDTPLTAEKMKEYHRILKAGTLDAQQDWFVVGDWKKLGNVVGETETTKPEDVEGAIATLLASFPQSEVLSFDDIIDFHWRFESIHPFQDGNGRIGRIIMFEQCLQNDILPFIVLDDEKYYYYRGLQEYPTEKGFLLDTCRSFQDKYFATYKDMVA